jgi:hypothetical protein
MSENQPKTNPAAQILRGILLVAGVILLVGACGVAFFNYNIDQSPRGAIISLATVLAGLFLSVFLMAASSIVGMLAATLTRLNAAPADDVRPALERLEQSLRLLNNMQSRTEQTPSPAVEQVPGTLSTRAQHTLEQLRDFALMNDEQKQRYAARHWAHRKTTHLEAIERDVLVGNWVTAFARLDELQIVIPGDPQVAEMRERVESEQVSRLDEDVRVARGRLHQLIGAGLWQQAEELAAAVQVKYPAKDEADRLVEDVRRERESWERETMERLFRDIAAASERRQWRQALLALEEFIRRYPLDPRAEALKLDLPRMQENAAAQERKEQEEHFKDLLKRQRYEEALYVARALIARYPQSPTGIELSRMLPKVEELARQEAAKLAEAESGVPAQA